MLHLSTTPESHGGGPGGRWMYKAQDCHSRVSLVHSLHPESCLRFGLDNKSTLVKVKDRLWFQLNVPKHVVSQVTADFFCFNPDHDLSLTLTKCYQCLNITLKINNALVTPSDTQKQMKHVVSEHFCNILQA